MYWIAIWVKSDKEKSTPFKIKFCKNCITQKAASIRTLPCFKTSVPLRSQFWQHLFHTSKFHVYHVIDVLRRLQMSHTLEWNTYCVFMLKVIQICHFHKVIPCKVKYYTLMRTSLLRMNTESNFFKHSNLV